MITHIGAKATIPLKPNHRHALKEYSKLKRPRDFTAWEIQKSSLKGWKVQNDYHRRSLVETAFFRYKQIFDGKLASRKLENQEKEALLQCHLLNKITSMAMPVA